MQEKRIQVMKKMMTKKRRKRMGLGSPDSNEGEKRKLKEDAKGEKVKKS